MSNQAPGKRIGRIIPKQASRPGARTLEPSTSISLLAVYLQALRIGAAAHDRLERLAPVLAATAAPTVVAELDARRALRELDDALACTRVVTAPIAAAIAGRRDELIAKRDALPADLVARLAA
jgi:hypothetical protein